MSEETKTSKIFEAIPKVMADISAIGKSQRNQQQGFNFRGIDDVYNEVSKHMAKHGVFNVSKIVREEQVEFTSKKQTKGVHVKNKYEFTFYASDGSSVVTEALGEAMDYGDKAQNKAASIAHKYALLQIFCIPTAEKKDPDHETHNLNNNNQQRPQQRPQQALPQQHTQQIIPHSQKSQQQRAPEPQQQQQRPRSQQQSADTQIDNMHQKITVGFNTSLGQFAAYVNKNENTVSMGEALSQVVGNGDKAYWKTANDKEKLEATTKIKQFLENANGTQA